MSDLLLLHFDSNGIPAAERYATYASAMVNFELDRIGDGSFHAAARVWRVGALAISHLRHVSPLRYTRNAARVATDTADHFYLNFHASGWVTMESAWGMAKGGADTLLAIDMRQPCVFEAESRNEISLAIPRRLLLPRLKGRDPHGMIASGGLVPLMGRVLTAIVASLDGLDIGHADAVEGMVVDLAAETLLDAMQAAEALRPGDEAVARRARAFIEQHLSEPLDVAMICEGAGASRSRLYRAFDGRGGVLRQLQQCRLRRMRAFLENPSETRPIAELATLAGFADKAHFARSFKREYGVTPGQFRADRRQAAAAPPAARTEAARVFGNMVRALD